MLRTAAAGRTGARPGPAARPWLAETLILTGFLAAGVAATWPEAAGITGSLPRSDDVSSYVWGLWWVAHQVSHLGNPWYTSQLAAPAGTQLGFDTLMPLLGVVMTPVTLAFGPAVSFSLLNIVVPGLSCYAMYRAARLWLPGRTAPVATGALFGLSAMLAFQDWQRLHVAAGVVFLPLALAAAVRLRREPTVARGAMLGLTLGAAVLVSQETAVMAAAVAALVLGPWLAAGPGRARRLRPLGTAVAVAAVLASPQLIAMLQQALAGGATAPPAVIAGSYQRYVAELPGLFAPSPRLAATGLGGLGAVYRHFAPRTAAGDMLTTYGVALSALAMAGVAARWRRRSTWQLLALWLGSSALALGPALHIGAATYVPLAQQWHGVRVSRLLPYTWLVRLPGLAGFREADRFALAGLVGAALLAGAGVEWLRRRAWPLLIVAAVLAAGEAGWHSAGAGTMPFTLPAVDRPVAADRSGSIVVDVPFGLRGGLPLYGAHLAAPALLLAAADGHPRAESYVSWEPEPAITAIRRQPFYAGLAAAQRGGVPAPSGLAAARADRRRLGIGWVLVWIRPPPSLTRYLSGTGFRFAYQADGVRVYRPIPGE